MERRRIRRPKQYMVRIRPFVLYSDDKFIKRYRLNKETVNQLALEYEAGGFCNLISRRGGAIPPEDRMCLALRYFATGSNFSVVGDYQGVEKSTVSRIVDEVSTFLYTRQQDYINFPNTGPQKYEKAREFYEIYGEKPFCLGCVDGTHIPILSPTVNEGAFINRKNFHSLNTMIISDANKIIMHVDPRWPGSVNDAYVLRNSLVWQRGEEGLFGDYYFLGDSGYPLQPFVFTPILRPQGAAEERFNRWHKKTRASVESTIGILKQRFRCLDDSGGYLHHTPEKSAKIITSCVCLHNIARNMNMPPPPAINEEDADAVRPVRNEREQPPHEIVRNGEGHGVILNERARFIRNNFQ